MQRLITVINEYAYFRLHRRHVALAASRHYHVTIACPLMGVQNPDEGEGALDFTSLPLEADRVAPLSDLRSVFALWRLFLAQSPAVIHAITVKAIIVTGLAYRLAYCLTAQAKRPRLVVTFPGLGRGLSGAYSPYKQKIVDALLRFALGGGNTVLTFETEVDKQTIERRVAPIVKSMHVINGTGVNFALYQPPNAAREGAIRVLFAGRLLRSKGVLAFAEAAKQAHTLYGAGRVEFLIAGWPYPAPDCLNEAEIDALKAAPFLNFLGHVREMPHLLASIDAIILPSHYPEGIPRILIEAAACEAVPIASDFAGARCIINPNETGFVLKKPEASAILEAVAYLIARADRGRELGCAARRHVIAMGMSEEAVQGSFISIFQGKQDK